MDKESNFKLYINEFFDNLTLYDDYYNGHNYKNLLKASIDVFLDYESSYTAYEIYQIFFMIYQITSEHKSLHKDIQEGVKNVEDVESAPKKLINEPNTLIDLVSIMKGYEENTGDLIEKQRDHFIHSVNVFLLGLAIYSQNEIYRDIFNDYIEEGIDGKYQYEKYYKIDEKFSHEEFLYRWGVASLFHDIGYPVEIIGKQLKQFIKEGIQPISSEYSVEMGIDFKDFDEFNHIVEVRPDFADYYLENWEYMDDLDFFKPTDIMAQKIAREFDVDINDLKDNLDNFVNIMNENGFIDHGFFSSILVMDSYGYLIQKYAKNYDFFFYPIVDSATAILLHNYYGNTLNSGNYDFKLGPMDPERNPLAYLLILCDELQEWNRQPFGLKDKLRNHVNELDISIDDELNIRFIMKHGSMGLDFSSKKEKFLRNVLDIHAIFPDDLHVKTDIDNQDKSIEEDAMRTIVKNDIQAPEVLARNVEKLAIEIHNKYNETVENQYFDLLKEIYDDSGKFEKSQIYSREKILNLKYQSFDFENDDSIFTEISDLKNEFNEIKNNFEKEALKNLSEEYLTFEKIHNEYSDENMDAIIQNPDLKEYVEVRTRYEKIGELDSVISEMNDIKAKHHISPDDDLDNENGDYAKFKELEKRSEELLKEGIDKDAFNGLQFYDFKKKYEESKPFEELSSDFKMSNIRQAKTIPKKLAMIGCELAYKDDERDEVLKFTDEEVNDLAILEHEDWCEEREGKGWTLGPKKDADNKITPYLIPWTELDPKIQEYDKDPVRNIPIYAKSIGLKVVRSRLRLLTIEMHKNHEEGIPFEELPSYIKYSNYKYTDSFVKNFAQEGYDFVSIDEPGNSINSLKPRLINEICRKEHEQWCSMRERLGWSYGEERDEIEKTNPNMVPWKELNPDVKKANKLTIKRLPEYCEKVGLKIVKN